MKINKEKVKKLAKLANLNFDEEEMTNMISDLEEMLDFVNKLDEVNTEDVGPLTHIHDQNIIRREDQEVRLEGIKGQILKNSPSHNSDYIKVPNVLSKNDTD